MPDFHLSKYIRKQIAAGKTDDDIIARSLTTYGWSEEEIRKELTSIKRRPQHPNALEDALDFRSRRHWHQVTATVFSLLSVAAGVLLKATNMLQLQWIPLILCMFPFVGALCYTATRRAGYTVALFICAFVVLGLLFLLGISGPQHPYHTPTPTASTSASAH